MHTTAEATNVMEVYEASLAFVPEVLVEALQRESGDSRETVLEKLTEVKKYLALCASTSCRNFATSRILDETWHVLILHTYLYETLCREYLGKFVHHRPTDKPETALYIATKAELEAIFGPLNKSYWPDVRNEAADCDSGACANYCSCATCDTLS